MTGLVREARLVLTAVQFLTRVPVPRWVGWSPEQLNASAQWFPLVGVFVGAVAGGVFEAARLVWPVPLAVMPTTLTTSSWLFPPRTREVQFDEKWSFVGKKQKNCDPLDPTDDHTGDYWDHVAFDPLCGAPRTT